MKEKEEKAPVLGSIRRERRALEISYFEVIVNLSDEDEVSFMLLLSYPSITTTLPSKLKLIRAEHTTKPIQLNWNQYNHYGLYVNCVYIYMYIIYIYIYT